MAELKVSGKWDAQQSNGFLVTFDLQQSGTVITGSASHSEGRVTGRVEGSVRGKQFLVSVRWSNGSIGEYNATFNNQGRLTGVSFDVNHPQSQATWMSLRVFRPAGSLQSDVVGKPAHD